jgi:hypothetical protein
MTAPARFKQADIARALKGAKNAGFDRVRVTVDRAGNLVIDVIGGSDSNNEGANEWDVVLA